MNKQLTLLFFILYALSGVSQNTLTLKIESLNQEENAFIQSLDYNSTHPNYNSINQTLAAFEEQLNRQGYFSYSKKDSIHSNLVTYTYHLGQRTTTLILNTRLLEDHVKELTNLTDSPINIPIAETELTIQNTLNKLEQSGYGTSTLQLKNHRLSNDTLYADLHIALAKKRTLDRITIVSVDKIPTSIIQTSLKKELHQTFSEQTVDRINDKIASFNFIQSSKPTETLFTQDSTYVYLYLSKKNNNQFDGYIGFNNDDDGKLKLNGYLDLRLNNILNKGEAFELMWKNNGNKQSDFHFSTEVPYLFKTPLAVKGAFEVQKQDSTFQNTTLEINLGYYLNHQNKVFIGYQTLNSATNEETNSTQNYDSKYATLTYAYVQRNPQRLLFPINQELYLKVGTGKRNSETENNNQSFIEFTASKNFEITPTNLFYVKWNTYYLKSDTYYFNELKRFGGAKTLRGFQENSLTAKAFTIVNTEYRIQLGSNLSLNSILDYAYIKNPLSNENNHLYAIGFGMGMLTKNSHFQLAFANGKLPNEKMSFQNTTIHLSMSTFF